MSARLPSFGSLLRSTWELIRPRLRGLVVLALLPLLSLPLFLLPRLFPTPWSSLVATAVLIVVALVVNTVSTVSILAYLGDPRVGSGWKALARGLERWFPYLVTELLVGTLLIAVMVPGFLLGPAVFRSLNVASLSPPPLDMVFLIVLGTLGLFLPGLVVVVWYGFAPIAVAIGARPGPSALSLSVKLVRGHFGAILTLLLLWFLVQAVLTRMVSPLPIMNVLIPYAAGVFGLGYVVTLYHALRKV